MELSQDFKEFIKLLNAHNAEYLVVGGYAVAIHGFPRTTGDIDFWVNPVAENAQRIVNVLADFGFGSLDINSDDFCKADNEDHHHKNTKGCLGCSYFKTVFAINLPNALPKANFIKSNVK